MERRNHFFVCVLFFFSGISALIYEICWLGRLQLVMGHTVYAISTLVSAYLAGLAIGAYLVYRLARGGRHSFFYYVICEFIIGVYGYFFFDILAIVQVVYGLIVAGGTFSLALVSLLQFFFCGVVVFIPTVLMGATLPLLTDFLYSKKKSVAKNLPLLYGVNTLGAAFSAGATGFFLIPSLGYTNTIYIGVFLNFLIVIIAYLGLEGTWYQEVPTWREVLKGFKKGLPKTANKKMKGSGSVCLVLGVSGIASIFMQLSWFRLGQVSFGPSVYVFPLILFFVLLGIGLGSFLVYRYRRDDPQFKMTALLLLLSALSLRVTDGLFAQLPLWLLHWHQWWDLGFWTVIFLEGISLTLIVLPTAILIGSLFPFVVGNFIGDGSDSIRKLGLGIFSNIWGVVLGGLIAPFYLIPTWGTQNLSILTSVLLMASAFILIWRENSNILLLVSLIFVSAITFKIIPRYNQEVLNEGYFYNREKRVDAEELLELGHLDFNTYQQFTRERLLTFREDAYGIFTVAQGWGNSQNRWFKINGKIDGNRQGGDVINSKLISLMPSLVREDYKSAYVIGLGTGLSASLVSLYPEVERITVSEVSDSMIDIAKEYFPKDSASVWEKDIYTVVNRDGREFLQNNATLYDLIISEPSNPWVDGVASLFTYEFFKIIKQHLTENGVFTIWFHSYSLECSAIESVILSMAKVFPDFVLFQVKSNFFMVGKKSDGTLKFSKRPPAARALAKEWSEVIEKLYDPNELANSDEMEVFFKKSFINRGQAFQKYFSGAIFNTDDNQYLQFRAGKSFFQDLNCNMGYLRS